MESWKRFLKEGSDNSTQVLRRSAWGDIDEEGPRTVGQLIMDEIANVLGVGPDSDITLRAAAAVADALGLDARKQLDQLEIGSGEPGWIGTVEPEEFPEKDAVDRRAPSK